MRNLLYPIQRSNVVQCIDAGRETAVEAEDLVFDEGGEREEIEKVGEVLPHVGVAVFAQALVVEAVDLCDLAGFVVTAEDGDALRITDFEGDEKGHSLDREITTINVVTFAFVR